MRFLALATDYDGTLAHDGIAKAETLEALQRFRESGRKLILVTGRRLGELKETFPELDTAFDMVVVENGATLYFPDTNEERRLSEAPSPAFTESLRRRQVSPLAVGQVIVATLDNEKDKVLAAIEELGLELHLIFNKGSLMILPSGVNKASGLDAALKLMKLSPHNVVAVGDAENDHAFLGFCQCSAAVANALPSLKERADLILTRDHGDGVVELIQHVIDNDLAHVSLPRHDVLLGTRESGGELRLPAHAGGMLVAGGSGGGKSTLTTGLLERFSEAGYQFCAIDPEGDHRTLTGAVILGDANHGPSADEVLGVLDDPSRSVIVNLMGVPFEQRSQFFEGLLPRLQEQRAKCGRPHWIVVDEAHHLLPATWEAAEVVLPKEIANLVLITMEPDHIAKPGLTSIPMIVAVGAEPQDTLSAFARATGVAPQDAGQQELPKGKALAWWKDGREVPVRFEVAPSKTDPVRHRRKYAEAELTPDRSFYFRGPEGKLNLRAQNLITFMQLMDGVDDETWLHHLRNREISEWFRTNIKNEELAKEASQIEHNEGRLTAGESRSKFREIIEARYTLPV